MRAAAQCSASRSPAPEPVERARISPFFLMIKLLPIKAEEDSARAKPTRVLGFSILPPQAQGEGERGEGGEGEGTEAGLICCCSPSGFFLSG